MERTEPALVPEWLRSSGNVAGGGASANHSDISSSGQSMQSRSFNSNSEKYRTDFLDRNSSFNSRHSSSSNGSAKHPYSSFTRSRRDKISEKEKEKSVSVDIWDHDAFEPLISMSTSRAENSALKRSHSLISRKTGEAMPRRAELLKNSINHQNCAIGVHSGVSTSLGIKQNTFEKDFPSLGTEEKQTPTGIRRNYSPGLSSAVQNLPMGNSGFLGGEKWTSALAEVPAILASNGMDHLHLQQSMGSLSASASGNSSIAGLNMAEALSKSPVRVHATQLPDKSQRLEELAIKQSRQLIPVTPSMLKPLALSSADKLKQPKAGIRTSETVVASKPVQLQPHSSHLSNQSRVGPVRSDSSSTSQVGRFMVLKSGRESGVTTGIKDVSNSSGDSNCNVTNEQIAVSPSGLTSSLSSNSSKVSVLESKVAALSLNSGSTVDKRLSQSLAKSRSEFFNLMRRKTSPAVTTNLSDSSLGVAPPSVETSDEILKEEHSSMSPLVFENDIQIICNSDGHDSPEKVINLSDVGAKNAEGNGTVYPDEEEAAFLRSLGWEEENGGDDEGLTEEEINAFYLEYMNRRPSLKVCSSSQLKCSTPSEFHTATSGITGSDSNISKSKPEI